MPPLQGASGQPGLGRESGTPDSRTEGSSDPEHSLHTLLKTLLGDGRAANQPPPRTGEAPGRQAQSAGHRGLDSQQRDCAPREAMARPEWPRNHPRPPSQAGGTRVPPVAAVVFLRCSPPVCRETGSQRHLLIRPCQGGWGFIIMITWLYRASVCKSHTRHWAHCPFVLMPDPSEVGRGRGGINWPLALRKLRHGLVIRLAQGRKGLKAKSRAQMWGLQPAFLWEQSGGGGAGGRLQTPKDMAQRAPWPRPPGGSWASPPAGRTIPRPSSWSLLARPSLQGRQLQGHPPSTHTTAPLHTMPPDSLTHTPHKLTEQGWASPVSGCGSLPFQAGAAATRLVSSKPGLTPS